MNKENLSAPLLLLQNAIGRLQYQLASGNAENPLLILSYLEAAEELLKNIYANSKRG